MEDAVVSVIVPVYKVEKYLAECITSIINQTYRSLEVILIDDGSPDSCGEICDYYANVDQRITVIHKKNEGQSAARNTGLNKATGDYIVFVDSDDVLPKDAIEHLVTSCVSTKSDAVFGDFITFETEHYKPVDTVEEKPLLQEIGKYDFYEGLYSGKTKNCVWGKIYKREILDGVFFLEGRIFEDVCYINALWKKNPKIQVIDSNVYCYRVGRPGSTQSSFDNRRLEIRFEFEATLDDVRKNGSFAEREFRMYLMDFWRKQYIQAVIHNATPTARQIAFDEFKKVYVPIVNMKFVLFRNFPYLYAVLKNKGE